MNNDSIIAHLDESLEGLKDFQWATVQAVMTRFDSADSSGRILVADEVGLGKTIVAKGVIVELLKAHLRDTPAANRRPFRVTYICSNLTLASENRQKLAVFRGALQRTYVQEPSYSRLLEVAVRQTEDNANGKVLELCSLTPSTSFTLTRGHGNWYERRIIYFALIQQPELSPFADKLSEFMSDGVKKWESAHVLESTIVETFKALLTEPLTVEIKNWCEISASDNTALQVLSDFCNGLLTLTHQTRFRAHLRSLMAKACAKHLTADLFILDEFQRFKALLDTHEDDDQTLVAQQVFNNNKVCKVLLLSATPFKALSHAEDDENGEAHAEELRFLLDFISRSDVERLNTYENHRKALQQQLLALRHKDFTVMALSSEHKRGVEDILSRYICRTERSQISEAYEDVFESSTVDCIEHFSADDIHVFKALDQLGQALGEVSQGHSTSQVMEFYKAAPWPLSFLAGYQFRKQLEQHRSELKQAIRQSEPAWLSRDDIQHYRLKLADTPHAKTRALVAKLFETRSEELLWVPPSLPHYPLEGSFKGQEYFTKTLLFSSWVMVPRALSGLISYEAERRVLPSRKGLSQYHRDKKHTPRIRFAEKSSLAGWSLIYPSRLMCDMPLETKGEKLVALLKTRTTFFNKQLLKLKRYVGKSAASHDHWYALAPVLLDKESGYDAAVIDWFETYQPNEGQANYARFYQYGTDNDSLPVLGEMPADLGEFLAYLSIASPAVVTARMGMNLFTNETFGEIALQSSKVANAFIDMFNKPEVTTLLRNRYPDSKYFRAAVRYAADGDLQAVVDEYGHLLKGAGVGLPKLAEQICNVLTMKTVSVDCQFREERHRRNQSSETEVDEYNSLRCHYAVPLGSQKLSDEKGVQRMENIRDAFNSPFRPFVLNSTSIGQEGLDFHWYCRRVVHWNLPANPIDIEQREGRVNRFKSLLVRTRLAEHYKTALQNTSDVSQGDIWERLFQLADTETKASRKSDLSPYWHYPQGTSRIERFVPIKPMSREQFMLDKALKILALYRLVFGQPRQEELMENLLGKTFSDSDIESIKNALMINLSPLLALQGSVDQ